MLKFSDGMQLRVASRPSVSLQNWTIKTSNAAICCEVDDYGTITFSRDPNKKISSNTKVTVTVTANDGSRKTARITIIV